MATPLRPSPLSFNTSGRESPFKRQNSTASPATTVRASTPSHSPTKHHSPSSLSPEKTSPFVRRPSQISQTSERPSSPLARAGSSLSFDDGPERSGYRRTESPSRQTTPAVEEDERSLSPAPLNPRNRPSPFDGSPAPDSPSSKTVTNISTTPTIKPPVFSVNKTPAAPTIKPQSTFANTGAAGYNQIPPALLRSMRESFEVLDASNSGSINPASVASMLDQLGLPSDSFPLTTGPSLNLARYLDTLSAPLAQLSHPDELSAAFSAFDVDDSGQIDVEELKHAMMGTAPEPGEEDFRLSEREVDGILAEFAGRRAFGGKGTSVAKGKGEVFRWREFMAGISGGTEGEGIAV